MCKCSGEQFVSTSFHRPGPSEMGLGAGVGGCGLYPHGQAMCVRVCCVHPGLLSDPIQEFIFPAWFLLHLSKPLF